MFKAVIGSDRINYASNNDLNYLHCNCCNVDLKDIVDVFDHEETADHIVNRDYYKFRHEMKRATAMKGKPSKTFRINPKVLPYHI
jgi:hypothetical protein